MSQQSQQQQMGQPQMMQMPQQQMMGQPQMMPQQQQMGMMGQPQQMMGQPQMQMGQPQMMQMPQQQMMGQPQMQMMGQPQMQMGQPQMQMMGQPQMQMMGQPQVQMMGCVPSGKLDLTIVSCKSIKAMDLNGKSDVFVIVSVGPKLRNERLARKAKKFKKIDSKTKTKVVKKSLDPVFNHKFMDLWDYDKFGTNDYIGTAKLPLDFLCKGETYDFDIGVENEGSVKIKVHCGFGYPAQHKNYCLQRTLMTIWKPVYARGTVKVMVCRAEKLIGADASFLKKANSDPYCVVSIISGKPQPTQTQMSVPKKNATKVVKKDKNPTWNEMFDLPVKSMHTQKVCFKVYDWDRIGGNDLLGYGKVKLKEGLVRGLPRDFVVKLKAPEVEGKKRKGGTLYVKLQALDFGWNSYQEMGMRKIKKKK